jgi:hypothetical protein
MNEKRGPHSLCWIMATLSALPYFEVPVLGLLPLQSGSSKHGRSCGAAIVLYNKSFEVTRHFTRRNLLKLHVSGSRIFILLPSIHSARESVLTLVVKEESLPCSYPWGFTSCGMFTRCCCSMLGHSLLVCEEPPVQWNQESNSGYSSSSIKISFSSCS